MAKYIFFGFDIFGALLWLAAYIYVFLFQYKYKKKILHTWTACANCSLEIFVSFAYLYAAITYIHIDDAWDSAQWIVWAIIYSAWALVDIGILWTDIRIEKSIGRKELLYGLFCFACCVTIYAILYIQWQYQGITIDGTTKFIQVAATCDNFFISLMFLMSFRMIGLKNNQSLFFGLLVTIGSLLINFHIAFYQDGEHFQIYPLFLYGGIFCLLLNATYCVLVIYYAKKENKNYFFKWKCISKAEFPSDKLKHKHVNNK